MDDGAQADGEREVQPVGHQHVPARGPGRGEATPQPRPHPRSSREEGHGLEQGRMPDGPLRGPLEGGPGRVGPARPRVVRRSSRRGRGRGAGPPPRCAPRRAAGTGSASSARGRPSARRPRCHPQTSPAPRRGRCPRPSAGRPRWTPRRPPLRPRLPPAISDRDHHRSRAPPAAAARPRGPRRSRTGRCRHGPARRTGRRSCPLTSFATAKKSAGRGCRNEWRW